MGVSTVILGVARMSASSQRSRHGVDNQETFENINGDNLEFEAFHRTQGWAQNIVVRDEKAYLPSGYFGVQTLELGDGG